MAISEESRHDLYQALEQAIGHEQATTLMEHLPPVGWADVATRRDLDLLEARVTAAMERRISDALRTQVVVSVSSVMAAVSLAFAAARL
jgi:hypothetical protein